MMKLGYNVEILDPPPPVYGGLGVESVFFYWGVGEAYCGMSQLKSRSGTKSVRQTIELESDAAGVADAGASVSMADAGAGIGASAADAAVSTPSGRWTMQRLTRSVGNGG